MFLVHYVKIQQLNVFIVLILELEEIMVLAHVQLVIMIMEMKNVIVI